MKKAILFALSALSLSMAVGATAAEQHSTLPIQYESVFDQSMNDPNVMIYYADKSYRAGDHKSALRWMLEAAQYEHPAAVTNAKYMIENSLGTVDNRESVIEFLRYYAEPRGDEPADIFAQRYLADYYRGDRCVWFAPDEKIKCSLDHKGPMASSDMRQSYFYYEGAAQQGDVYSRYVTGMMNLLGIGVPRNVPLSIEWLRPLAEKGNTSVAYLIGSIYQLGYWMPMDKVEASKWFSMAGEMKQPGALLYLAKNAESGAIGENEDERYEMARAHYADVTKGVLADTTQRAEAYYRSALLQEGHPDSAKEIPTEYMIKAVKLGERVNNEFSVKALIWLGEQKELSALDDAIAHYKEAIAKLRELPIDIQQRHVTVWKKIAHAYGRGQEGHVERDERLFSKYMKESHVLMAKTYLPKISKTQFQGYSAFHLPE